MPINKKRGFTLLNIILITVVIASQLAILYPLLEKSKEQSKLSTCQTNIRTCAIALHTYWNDYDATLPSSAVVADPPGSAPTNAQVVNFLTSAEDWPHLGKTKPKSWAHIMVPYIHNPDTVFCPSDSPRSRLSYWWKYSIDLAWRDKDIDAKKEGDFGYNSDQIVLYEHAGWHVGDAAGIKNGLKINVAYLDTHVATVTIKNGPSDYPLVSEERSGAAAIRLGAPMYYNYDNNTSTAHPGVANYIDPRRYSDAY